MSSVQESITIEHRPGDNTGVGVVDMVLDKNGLVVSAPARIKQGASIVYEKQVITFPMTAASITAPLWVAPEGRWQVAGVMVYAQTGSSSGTLQITVESGTTAPGSGTAQMTGTISLAAAVQQTLIQGTLITTPTVLGPGDRLSALIAGTMTSLALAIATVTLVRIS